MPCRASASFLLADSLWRSILKQRDGAAALAVANRQLSAEAARREELIQELEARNTELERFTYTVSHDLKSPLITIGGFIGYLEQHVAAGNTEEMRADLARIADAQQSMSLLLNELLELSRVGAR